MKVPAHSHIHSQSLLGQGDDSDCLFLAAADCLSLSIV